MDKTRALQNNSDEIRADWPDSSFDEKQNYVLELDEMTHSATEIRTILGTKLLREVGVLRGHIEQQILPAQQKRNVDARLC